MNAKQIATYAVVALLLVAGWELSVYWVKKAHPEWVFNVPPQTQPTTTTTTTTAPDQGTPSTSPQTQSAATGPTTRTGDGVPATLPAGQLRATVPAGMVPAVVPVELGSATKDDANFAMLLTLSSRGAGIDEVALNQFNRAVTDGQATKDFKPYVFQEPYDGFYSMTRPLATRWISIDGKQVDLSGVDWAMKRLTGSSVEYSVEIQGDEGAVARVVKTFTLKPKSDPSLGYEVSVDYKIENATGKPIKVKTEWNGPTVPPQELVQSDRMILTGLRDGRSIDAGQHMLPAFKGAENVMELLTVEKKPVQWAGGASAYFNALLLPIGLGDLAAEPAQYIESIRAERLEPNVEDDLRYRKVAMTFRTKELDVAANGSLTLPLSTYFGPRSRHVLDTPYYEQLPRVYSSILVIRTSYCGFCAFPWLMAVLVSMLSFFHAIWRDWGLAIITLVVIVRAILHPITKRSQVNMMKMGKFGPEIEKLKKKYGDDKDELNKQMMLFYKEHGATPILGCLPMFLQMPIWIALFSVLQSTFELRQEPFLYGWTWIHDLSKPDGLVHFAKPFQFLFFTIDGINLLPILLAFVFWLNQKYTPKPPATTPEQEQQQKMMQWMSLLFPVAMYSMPSGLLLYTFSSTAIGIVESKVIRKHIKEREELEAAQGPVIVDAPPTRGNRRKDRGDDLLGGGGRGTKGPAKPTPGGWFGKKLAELQEKAEAIKREADRKGR